MKFPGHEWESLVNLRDRPGREPEPSPAGIDGSGTRRAVCVLAPNPSPVTLTGTNTWIIAEPGSPSVIVVDPGPCHDGHLRRVLEKARAGRRNIAQIILTHRHKDHSAGAARLAAMSGAPVVAAGPGRRAGPAHRARPAHRAGPQGRVDRRIVDGELIVAAGCEVRVVSTPGHSWDSVCLLLPADRALLTGDTVLGHGVTAIARNGDLRDYLGTLDKLSDLAGRAGLATLLPGHGPVRDDPAAVLDQHISHCHERLSRVQAAVAAGARAPAEIVARVFGYVDPAAQRAAESSVRAQLDYLESAD